MSSANGVAETPAIASLKRVEQRIEKMLDDNARLRAELNQQVALNAGLRARIAYLERINEERIR